MNVLPLKTILTKQPWKPSSTITVMPVPHPSSLKPTPSLKGRVSLEHISWLWIQLTSIYGQLFINKHGTKDSGLWLEALQELTPKALESGVARIKALSAGDKFLEYPPNCLQFKALCLAFYEDLRLPKASDAYQEIRNKSYSKNINWSHAAVKFTAQRLSIDFLAIKQEAEAYALFKEVYGEVCHLVRQGHALPEMQNKVMLPKTPDRELAKMHLQTIRQQLGA